MQQKEVDMGEIIRELLSEERKLINKFEAAEIEANKVISGIDRESERLLSDERKKAEIDAEKIVEKAEKKAEKDAEGILIRKKEEITELKKKFSAKKAKMVDNALENLIEEVQNAFSAENS